MSLPVSFSPEALQELEELEEYIARASYPDRAEDYIVRLVNACHAIGLAPFQGKRRDDIRPNLRTAGFERRVTILFEAAETSVTIVGIFYGGRRIRSDAGQL